MLERMCRDNYLLYCNVSYIIRTGILLSVIWYIASTSTTDVCVTLPPNFRQVLGYPPIKGQNIKVIPIFFVNISFYVLDISRFKKKLAWVKCVWGGGGRAQ